MTGRKGPINMPDQAGYLKLAVKLRDAADELLRQQKWNLQFTFPSVFWRQDVLVTGDLDALVQFAGNDDSRRWLQLLDEHTGHEATIAMFCMMVLPMLQCKPN